MSQAGSPASEPGGLGGYPEASPGSPHRASLAEILRAEDFHHRLRLGRGSPGPYFDDWVGLAGMPPREERRRWLDGSPEHHLLFLEEAAAAVDEAVQWLESLHAPGLERRVSMRETGHATPRDRWLDLAHALEPDLLLLIPGPEGGRLVAGAVCFPSSWAPEAKLGLTLRAIHEIVPGLNETLAGPIETLFERIVPGPAWFRSNWGLTASPEFNQHPVRNLPRPGLPLDPDRLWLRLEHQALARLPQTRALLFGIRVEHQPVADLRARDPAVALALARALRSMPEAMARYKGVSDIRHALGDHLGSV